MRTRSVVGIRGLHPDPRRSSFAAATETKGFDMSEQERHDDTFGGADKDRLEGAFDEAKGRVKGAAGELTGDAGLQGEGKVDQAVGKVKQGVGDAKDAANEAIRKVKDN
jgi:uncharacterized protein YjbJ (UPF0337 family)